MSKQSIDLLQKACGAAGQFQVTIERQDQPGTLEKDLYLPCFLVGRDENTDVVLDDPQVGQRHAYLQAIGGRLFCVDLQSRTGTRWLTGPRDFGWVDPDQILRIGPFALRFQGGVTEAEGFPNDFNPLVSPPPEPDNQGNLILEISKGPLPPAIWRFNRVLTLAGRASHCRVSLRDPSVSYFHFSVLRTALGYWIIDLLGRGGVALNGKRVRWSRLEDGDQVQVGAFTLRVRNEPQASPGLSPAAAVAPVPRTTPAAEGNNGSPGAVPLEPVAAASWGTLPPGASSLTPPGGYKAEPVSVGQPAPAPSPSPPPILPAEAPASVTAPTGEMADKVFEVGFPTEAATTPESAALMPLFHQFAAMQSQMFDQFQQALMMMVEMFSQMQREHVGLIRQEVDRLHQITAELQTLQAELTRTGAAPVPAAEPPEGVSPELVTALEKTLEAEVTPKAPVPANQPVPAAQTPPGPKPTWTLPPTASQADGEVHVWLHQRITQLQRERQTALQKILNFLLGK